MTLNVNGLGASGRAPALFHYLAHCCAQPDVVCLQEVRLADAEALEAVLRHGQGPGLPYFGQAFFSPGTQTSRGVAILLKGSPALARVPAAASALDSDGRVVRVDLECQGLPLSIMCVYAPCGRMDRAAFFDGLHALVDPGRTLLVGGDFNCITDAIDQTSAGAHRFVASDRLQAFMQDRCMSDAFRVKHPLAREFTHVGTAGLSAARLDRWLVGAACLPWVFDVQHVHGAPGDHAGVLLHLLPPDLPSFGPGRWLFPAHILHVEAHVATLKQQVQAFLLQCPAPTGTTGHYARWLELKAFLKDAAMAISRQHGRQQKQRRAAASREVSVAVLGLARAPADPAALARLVGASAAMKEVMYAEAGKVTDVSKAVWMSFGERCTAAHFGLVRSGDASGPIDELCDCQGRRTRMRDVCTGTDLTDLVQQHFSSDAPSGLYAIGATDVAAQNALLSCLDRRLEAHHVAGARGPAGDGTVTIECLARALAACNNGKSPGHDGLPYEVFKCLWDVLGEPLCAAVNDVFLHDVGDGAWAEGVIVPLYKGKGLPRDSLSSYRPITLLNCDYKLCARVVSDRLQGPLDYVVDPEQTAFIKGRWIGDNVLLRQGLMEELDAAQLPGVTLYLDVAKAYDRVDRTWLFRCAAELGLPACMCTWLKRLTIGTRSRVLLNGWLTHDFPVNNGLPQGSPLAPLLWVLQLQPLTAALRKAVRDGRLKTPCLPDGSTIPPAQHHADDSTLHLLHLHGDGPVALGIVQQYCTASNAVIEPSKSQAMCLGSHAPVLGQDAVTGVDFGQPTDPPRKALGVPLTRDHGAACTMVYAARVQGLRLTAHRWSMHPLTFRGRSLVAKQCMANALSYHATFVPPPAGTVKQMQDVINGYVARSRLPEDATLPGNATSCLLPKMAIACQPPHLGGASLPHLASHFAALQAKVSARWCAFGARPWSVLWTRALSRAAPHANWGAVWVFTQLPVDTSESGWARALPPRVLAFVLALRATGVAPLPPEGGGRHPTRALLLEPLYYSARVVDGAGRPMQPPPSAAAHADWPFTLGQLARCPAPLRADPGITSLEDALPPDMVAALTLARYSPQLIAQDDEWWCATVGPRVWVKHACALATPPVVELFEVVSPDGALMSCPASVVVPPVVTWLPACVLPAVKPLHRWTHADRTAYAQAPTPQRVAAVPTEHRLVGAWERMVVYPPAWGHDGVPLHRYEVQPVRVALTVRAAAEQVRKVQPDYVAGGALRPRLWRDAKDSSSGWCLSSLEQLWDDTLRRGQAFAPNLGAGTAWLAPRSTALQARLAAARTRGPPSTAGPAPTTAPPPAVSTAEQGEYTSFWRLLLSMHASNHVIVFAWRLAHAALPCAAMREANRGKCRGDAVCRACSSATGTARHLETYSHVFMECETFKPALRWLCALWHAVAGVQPPWDAVVLVAGDNRGWQQAPSGPMAVLWATLRATTLYSIWSALEAVDPAQRTAPAVVAAAIGTLRGEARVRYNREALSSDLALWVPRQLARGLVQVPQSQRDSFRAVWVDSGLCSVVLSGAAGGPSSLVVHLSQSFPVVAP